MNTNKLFLRILVSPIILILFIISNIYNTIYLFVLFIMYGGEWMSYDKQDKAKMSAIYEELTKNK